MESALYSVQSSFYLTKSERKDLFRLASKYTDDSKEENKYRDTILPEKQTPTSQKENFQNEVEELEKKIKDSKEDEKSKLYLDMALLYIKRTNSSRYNKDIVLDKDFPSKIDHSIQNAVRYSQNKEQEANIYYSLGDKYDYWDEPLSKNYNTRSFEVYMSMKKDMHSHSNFLRLAERLKKDPNQLYELITQTISNPEEKTNYYLEAANEANNRYSNREIAIALFQKALGYIKDNQKKAEINFMISKIYFEKGNEFQEKGIPFLRKAISFEQRKEEKEFYTAYLEWQLGQNKLNKISESLEKLRQEITHEDSLRDEAVYLKNERLIQTIPNPKLKYLAYSELIKEYHHWDYKNDKKFDYNLLISIFLGAANSTTNAHEKAKYFSFVSNIYTQKLNKDAESISYIEKAIELEPNPNTKAEYYLELGYLSAFLKPRQDELIRQSYSKALTVAESSHLKAKIYLKLGSYDQKYYKLATKVNPDYVRYEERRLYSPDEKRKKSSPEDWAGSPEDIEEKPFDYFYMRSYGRASEKAIRKRSGAMMQTTCTDAATTKVKGDLIGKLVSESYGGGVAGCSDGESSSRIVVREFGGKLGGVNVLLCRPRSEEDPGIPYSDWKECSCIVYVKIEGGREAIRQSILEADKRK